MNQTNLKFLFGLALISLCGCELSSTAEYKNTLSLNLKGYNEQVKFSEEDELFGEIYSLNSIESERQAIEEGFEPEYGVEDRLTTLDLYSQYAEEGSFIVIRFPRPINPDGFPRPVCPPKITDCKIGFDPVELNGFSFSFYCENPELIEAIVETEEGTVAELGEVSYNEESRQATIKFQVTNSELFELPTRMQVNTVITLNGEQVVEGLNAEMAEGVFK